MGKDEGTGTWRDTLYIWDGIVSVGDEKTKKEAGGDDDKKAAASDPIDVKWEGVWVGVEAPDAVEAEPPKRNAFLKDVESDMTFAVTGKAAKEGGATTNGGGDDKTNEKKGYYRVTMVEGAGWDMEDEKKKKQKHKDTVHDLYMTNLRWLGGFKTETLVYAKGENAHGPFIAAGWMRPGNRITLARRYLDADADPRAKWDVDDVKDAVLADIVQGKVPNETVRIPPWQCSVLHVQDQTGKKQKVDNDDGKAPSSAAGEGTGEKK